MRRLMRRFAAIFLLAALAGCVVAPAGGPGRAWVPGHYNAYGHWVPGHWR